MASLNVFGHCRNEISMVRSILAGSQSDCPFPDFSEIPEQFRLASVSRSNLQRILEDATSQSDHQRSHTTQVSDVRGSGGESNISVTSFQQRFPVFKFSGPRGSQCVVCYGKFKAGQNLKALSCLHKFHVTCIDPWLEKEHKCPVCRYDLMKTVDIHKL